MKKTLLIAAFLGFYFSSFAQTNVYHPFPDSNAIWHQAYAEGYTAIDTISYSYGFIGDTIINSKTYSKVYLLSDTALNGVGQYWGCLREDSLKRVFYLGKDYWGVNNFTVEIQLYDFGKNIGDSVNYGIWGKWPILSVDSILVGQYYRKRFEVLWDYFIEGIGSTIQLLSPVTDIPTKYYTHWDLVCFKQDEQVLFINSNYNTCFHSFGITKNSVIQKPSISISPNPFTQSTQITLNQTYQNIALEVYNLQGQLVAKHHYANCNEITLQRNHLPAGLYFLKLTLDNKATEVRKVVISE